MKLRVSWNKIVYDHQGVYGKPYERTVYRQIGEDHGLTNIVSETECTGTILNDTPVMQDDEVCFVVLLDEGSIFEVLPVHILTVIGY